MSNRSNMEPEFSVLCTVLPQQRVQFSAQADTINGPMATGLCWHRWQEGRSMGAGAGESSKPEKGGDLAMDRPRNPRSTGTWVLPSRGHATKLLPQWCSPREPRDSRLVASGDRVPPALFQQKEEWGLALWKLFRGPVSSCLDTQCLRSAEPSGQGDRFSALAQIPGRTPFKGLFCMASTSSVPSFSL